MANIIQRGSWHSVWQRGACLPRHTSFTGAALAPGGLGTLSIAHSPSPLGETLGGQGLDVWVTG